MVVSRSSDRSTSTSDSGAPPMTMTDPAMRNGVDTATLFATLDAVRAQPEAAAFTFRVSNRWISGTHSQGTVDTFFGVSEERQHKQPTVIDADHPEVLV